MHKVFSLVQCGSSDQCCALFCQFQCHRAEMGHGGTVGRCVQRVVTYCPVGTLAHEKPYRERISPGAQSFLVKFVD
ncbi:hypothetical protein TNIN_267061 [Trichonephila inaurata madagascariensis]|uniref:Uncharacterized protein n=1 Tax=Trichonephila inaurata madagascariensis TaxID=2747483 RepID=A0A8X6XI53_9ARAC|nr:hypothetical protein TNIN_267061 [Trichonephila inaurata madagascariensis]